MLRKGGRVAVIGIPLEAAPLPLRDIVLNELDIVGVRAAAGEMPRAIALVEAGKIRLTPLITHRFPLRDYAEAYRVFTERVDGALKVVVHPWEENE
jgi:L-iditol 2-dehydrogenase